MGKKELKLPSRDGIHQLHVTVWEPEQQIRAVVQISHGMVEMIARYEEFALFLNRHGIAVVGNDHLGHGETAGSDADLGYFCPENMSATVVADLYRVTKYAKKKYPGVPYFLLGHSMGSFMARRYLMTYGNELTGAVICGTGSQKKSVLLAGKVVSGIMRAVLGDRFRSKLLKRNAFGAYQKQIENPRTQSDWLTRDEAVVDFCMTNKYCSFDFTVNGYRTLFDVLGFIQNKKNVNRIPRTLPILFIAGGADPVGNYGKSVKAVYAAYKAAGIKKVNIRIYPDDRHEILNELDKDQVYADVLLWLERLIPASKG